MFSFLAFPVVPETAESPRAEILGREGWGGVALFEVTQRTASGTLPQSLWPGCSGRCCVGACESVMRVAGASVWSVREASGGCGSAFCGSGALWLQGRRSAILAQALAMSSAEPPRPHWVRIAAQPSHGDCWDCDLKAWDHEGRALWELRAVTDALGVTHPVTAKDVSAWLRDSKARLAAGFQHVGLEVLQELRPSRRKWQHDIRGAKEGAMNASVRPEELHEEWALSTAGLLALLLSYWQTCKSRLHRRRAAELLEAWFLKLLPARSLAEVFTPKAPQMARCGLRAPAVEYCEHVQQVQLLLLHGGRQQSAGFAALRRLWLLVDMCPTFAAAAPDVLRGVASLADAQLVQASYTSAPNRALDVAPVSGQKRRRIDEDLRRLWAET